MGDMTKVIIILISLAVYVLCRKYNKAKKSSEEKEYHYKFKIRDSHDEQYISIKGVRSQEEANDKVEAIIQEVYESYDVIGVYPIEKKDYHKFKDHMM